MEIQNELFIVLHLKNLEEGKDCETSRIGFNR
jgi:hypothetical protein